eukprot:1151808-Pelagomonas_calceolata.AAC.8
MGLTSTSARTCSAVVPHSFCTSVDAMQCSCPYRPCGTIADTAPENPRATDPQARQPVGELRVGHLGSAVQEAERGNAAQEADTS